MKTISDGAAKLKELGLTKPFKFYMDEETKDGGKRLFVETRKPARIVDGWLVGCEIVLEGRCFRVWTPQRKKGRAVAGEHGLSYRDYDGEFEFWVPVEKADEVLPMFGAKVKRVLSADEKAMRVGLMLKMREAAGA